MSDSDGFPAIVCCSRSNPYLGDPDLSVEVEQLADRFTAALIRQEIARKVLTD